MDPFENLFDEALYGADSIIIDRMGKTALITVPGEALPREVRGVFDDPENIVGVPGGGQVDDVSPSLFVRSADVTGVAKNMRVEVNAEVFWIRHITPDDTGSRTLFLVRGEPGRSTPAVPGQWVKK